MFLIRTYLKAIRIFIQIFLTISALQRKAVHPPISNPLSPPLWQVALVNARHYSRARVCVCMCLSAPKVGEASGEPPETQFLHQPKKDFWGNRGVETAIPRGRVKRDRERETKKERTRTRACRSYWRGSGRRVAAGGGQRWLIPSGVRTNGVKEFPRDKL